MRKLVEDKYEPRLGSARDRLEKYSSFSQSLDTIDEESLLRFFLNLSSYGVQMTQPVGGWIRAAGQRCLSLGYGELGTALEKHAAHEDGHHLMMIEDTKFLVRYATERGYKVADADTLMARHNTAAMDDYIVLHEDVITGTEPYAQIAIEYEIERLSTTLGVRLLARAREVFSQDGLSGLSFLKEHVALDVGHTHFNAGQMGRFLTQHPQSLDALVDAGQRALEAYGRFLSDCAKQSVACDSGLARTAAEQPNLVGQAVR